MSTLLLLVCVLLAGTCLCQRPVEWEADTYPNPMTEPKKCGRSTSSKVCDPNGIISEAEADILDGILLPLPNTTQCPCSSWSCDRPNKNKGYHIFVALVKKLKRKEGAVKVPKDTPSTRAATEGLAGKFTMKLLNENWKAGYCNEEVIIFYSKEDGILRTQTGSTAKLLLTDQIAGETQKSMARFFQNENTVGEGLKYLVLNYKRVLDGEYYLPIMYTDVAAGAMAVKISFFTSLITTIFIKWLC